MWTMTSLAGAFFDAAAGAADILDSPAVAERWAEPSALAEFSVRGLAGHLGHQVLSVADLLGLQTPPDVETVTLEDHYRGVPWAGADINTPFNVDIRTGGEERACHGHRALVAAVRTAIDGLRGSLADTAGQRPVFLPWTGWALTLDDFLTTRMMEMAGPH
jgi:hypothetical protein